MSKRVRCLEDAISFVNENSDCTLISDEYVGNREKMKFKCDCGDEFITTFNQFRKGKRKCNKCGFKRCNQDKIFTYSEIKAFIDLESDSGCTLISNEYTNCKTPIKLKCRCGNEFVTTFDSFKNSGKRRCNFCSNKNTGKTAALLANRRPKSEGPYNKSNHNEFVTRMYKLLKDEYSVLGQYTTARDKILVKHNDCGHEYYVAPDKILNQNRRCPNCSDFRSSKASKEIESWLTEHDVLFEKEYKFPDCKHQRSLAFDFAVLDSDEHVKCLIEYDGEQHFRPFQYIRDEDTRNTKFRDSKKRDAIKNAYCKRNNIPLIRISYLEQDILKPILELKVSTLL